MIRDALLALEEWIFDEASIILMLAKFALVIGIIMTPIVYLVAKHERDQMTACVANGDAWKKIGEHQSTIYIKVGNVFVPSTSTVNDYGCVPSR